MTSRRNWVLAVVALVFVGTIVADRLSGDNGDDRLVASAPSTAPQISLGRSTTTTTAAGDATGPATGAGSGAVATTVPGGSAAAATTPTTAPTTAGAPSPGITAAGERRVSGLSGGAGGDIAPITDPPASGRGGGSGATTDTTSTTAPATSAPTNLNLSRDDNTKAFTLKRNDSITLRLEPVGGAPWSEPVSSGAAVTRDFTSNLEGVLVTTFTATAAGTATITATGAPSCTQPCIGTPTAFSVTITVTT